MGALYWLIDTVLGLYVWVLIIHVILSWLIAFNVINTYNRFVNMIGGFTYQLTEPALKRIRRFVPTVGSVDLSVLVLILVIWFVRKLLWDNWGSTLRFGG
ncbi:MAG: YggT family protein [Alphaproteobacteria bacterium]